MDDLGVPPWIGKLHIAMGNHWESNGNDLK
jgi:hypothetical protein